MRSSNDDLERIAASLEVLKSEMDTIEEQINLVSTALTEIVMARRTFNGLKDNTSGEVLIPIGGDIRLPGKIVDLKPIVNVGSGIHVQMDIDKALIFLQEREMELKRTQEELNKRMDELTKEYNNLNVKAGQIYSSMKQGSGNVQIPERKA